MQFLVQRGHELVDDGQLLEEFVLFGFTDGRVKCARVLVADAPESVQIDPIESRGRVLLRQAILHRLLLLQYQAKQETVRLVLFRGDHPRP